MRRRSPECKSSGTGVAYGLQSLAQKREGIGVRLTERGIGQGSDADEPAASSGGVAGRRLGKTRLQGCSGFWTPWIAEWRACEGATVVKEARGSAAVRKRAVDRTHLWRRSGEIPVWLGVRGRGQRLGEVPGAQAKLRRGSSVDVVQRGGWSTAAQGVLRGGAVQGVRISGLWAQWSGWCGAEGHGRCLKEGAEDPGRACPA